MSQGSQPGVALREPLAYPLLLECDSGGKVLWISQRAREVLGEPAHLIDLVLTTRPGRERGAPNFRVYSWHFWRVWESGGRVVVAARPPHLPDRSQTELLRLAARLMRGFFRLVENERRLGDRVRRRRGGRGGRGAIRQIELERQRLGRDLHTGVGQMLAAVRLQLELIEAEMPLPPPKVKQSLDTIGTLNASALELVRNVSKRLHPPEWQRLTLEEAVRQLWALSGLAERFGGELRIEALPREPAVEVKALLYRAAQEAFSNVARHARATRVDVELRAEGERAVLKVSDNGVGFDVAQLWAAPASVAGGIGLRSVRELVAEAGGKFDMESGASGTKLVVTVEMNPRE